jgi:hypothetical protein
MSDIAILQQLCRHATILLVMKIVYRVSEQDFADAHDLFAANEPWYRRYSRGFLLWFGASVLGADVYYLIIRPGRDIALLAMGLAVGFSLLYCGFALRYYFRRAYRKDHRFKHEFAADISDLGIHIVTPFSDGLVRWNAFVRFLESNKIFMLFIAPWNFIVLPKRAFAQGEITEFKSILQRKIMSPD